MSCGIQMDEGNSAPPSQRVIACWCRGTFVALRAFNGIFSHSVQHDPGIVFATKVNAGTTSMLFIRVHGSEAVTDG
jgi:hypothetical protein